jgi:hypothetical protein
MMQAVVLNTGEITSPALAPIFIIPPPVPLLLPTIFIIVVQKGTSTKGSKQLQKKACTVYAFVPISWGSLVQQP